MRLIITKVKLVKIFYLMFYVFITHVLSYPQSLLLEIRGCFQLVYFDQLFQKRLINHLTPFFEKLNNV